MDEWSSHPHARFQSKRSGISTPDDITSRDSTATKHSRRVVKASADGWELCHSNDFGQDVNEINAEIFGIVSGMMPWTHEQVRGIIIKTIILHFKIADSYFTITLFLFQLFLTSGTFFICSLLNGTSLYLDYWCQVDTNSLNIY